MSQSPAAGSKFIGCALVMAVSLYAGTGHASQSRSSHARTEFKHEHPCPATGSSKGRCAGYVIDHVKPLACGGPDEPGNLQWQTVAEGKAKDRVERRQCKGK